MEGAPLGVTLALPKNIRQNDTQQKKTHQNDTQQNDIQMNS